jgi:hypothetical protein
MVRNSLRVREAVELVAITFVELILELNPMKS